MRCPTRRIRISYELYSLELNLHQLILSDLARNVGKSKDDKTGNITTEDTIELISSNVETRDISEEGGEDADKPRVFMVSKGVSVRAFEKFTGYLW